MSSGDFTEIRATLFGLTEKQGETTSELRNIHRILEERGKTISSIDAKLDKLQSSQDYAAGRQSVISTLFGLIGGGVATFLSRTLT